ncbi:MAG TPA: hypothetical protein VF691_17105 [Cytophagaceae bacterium]|jgi:hypothetical protein
MKTILYLPIFIFGFFLTTDSEAQGISKTIPFSLTSPFSEPDGRSDLVKLPGGDFITLAKVKGNTISKSEFALERYTNELVNKWKSTLIADNTEDFKELYYNGKELVLLSVIHKVDEKKTTLVAYAFDLNTGSKTWNKDLETYDIGKYEYHEHKGRVRESFIDVVCEHVDPMFVTPFQYKHNIVFSPDSSKFLSYVFNYADKNLFAYLNIYDKAGNVLKKGKVSIDNDYINHGIYLANDNTIYVLNENKFGKTNFIKYDLDTHDFSLIELGGSSYQKEDFNVHFLNDDSFIVANIESEGDKLMGVMYSKVNFEKKEVEQSYVLSLDQGIREKILKERKEFKNFKTEEDWRNYDLTNLYVSKSGEVFIAIEKRGLYSEGYPHIKKDAFDISHEVEVNGHVQAEGLILFGFDKAGTLMWNKYIGKNQIYPANDGLNTVSCVIDFTVDLKKIKIVYATSENMTAALHQINVVEIDKKSGEVTKSVFLPNNEKLIIVRDYTTWASASNLLFVGKKSLTGKASYMINYKID